MPRFYFDCFDGHQWVRDDLGLECPSLDYALDEAQDALPEILREAMLDRGTLSLRVRIRDKSGREVGETTLDLKTRPMQQSPDQPHRSHWDRHR